MLELNELRVLKELKFHLGKGVLSLWDRVNLLYELFLLLFGGFLD